MRYAKTFSLLWLGLLGLGLFLLVLVTGLAGCNFKAPNIPSSHELGLGLMPPNTQSHINHAHGTLSHTPRPNTYLETKTEVVTNGFPVDPDLTRNIRVKAYSRDDSLVIDVRRHPLIGNDFGGTIKLERNRLGSPDYAWNTIPTKIFPDGTFLIEDSQASTPGNIVVSGYGLLLDLGLYASIRIPHSAIGDSKAQVVTLNVGSAWVFQWQGVVR